MIESLSLRNFKAWKAVNALRFGQITGFFGTNSSGKTSLLQLLLLLKQTAGSSDRALALDLGDGRNLVELGTFRDILHGHDLSTELEWSLTWRRTSVLEVADPQRQGGVLFSDDRLTHFARIGWLDGARGVGRMSVSQHSYRFADREFGIRSGGARKGEFELFCTPGQDFRFVRVQGRAWPLPAPVKSYGFPDQVRGYFQNAGFLSDFELDFEVLFGKVFYLGPLREYPKREYAWAGGQPSDVGRRGEKVVEALLSSRERGATISEGVKGVKRLTVEARVAMWLKELGLIAHFEVRALSKDSKLYEVVVKRTPGSAQVLITDIGFGVSQILPVVTLCYYAPEGSTLILEQPEIHLHPAVQAGLADVLIHAVRKRRIQIVLESHSEHLLRRLQRRIAEKAISRDDVALYFCDAAAGASRLTRLDVDLYGSIVNWPPDFFGDEFGEIAAMQEAIVRRRREGDSQ